MDLQLIIDQEACIQCGACIKDCPYEILELSPDFPVVIADKADQCIQCQHCLAVCPTGALSILGFDPQDSLPLKGQLPTPEQMDVLIRGRRSVRRYKSTPLESSVIDTMMATIAHAPTGVNRRECLFTVVEEQAVMDKIANDTIAGIRKKADTETLPKEFEFFAGIVKAWDKGKDVLFRKAPHMLIISVPKTGPAPGADPIIAFSYFELLAASMNIGTLWDGLAKWAITDIVPEMQEKIGIPEDHQVGYVMLFGKPAVKYFRTVQRDKATIRRATYK